MTMKERSAYPLSWPDHWPRTTKFGSSSFRTTLAGALNNVQNAINTLRSKHHPDRGGDAAAFHEVQRAYEEARAQ
jgi:hypothetical protein